MRHAGFLVVIGALVGASITIGLLLGRREYLRTHSGDDELLVARGAAQFSIHDTPDDGLGPGFNATSCDSCHSIPDVGGSGETPTLRVAHRDPAGALHSYADGLVVPRFSARGCEPIIPADANVFSRRIPTSTFGSGLVEDIPDATLIALEDPQDRDGDGISGRAARVTDRATGAMRIGRFGWKAQHATLLSFTGDAYLSEMGITTDLYTNDYVIGVSAARQRTCEDVDDPEDSRGEAGARSIDVLTAFMRSLPAPDAGPEMPEGQRLFAEAGCASCHRPQVGSAHAYSDFLLHDVGVGDGIREADAAPEEMRTAPLWGIRDRSRYWHDGSAASIEAAIARHRVEAASARDRFRALSPEEKQELVGFVGSR